MKQRLMSLLLAAIAFVGAVMLTAGQTEPTPAPQSEPCDSCAALQQQLDDCKAETQQLLDALRATADDVPGTIVMPDDEGLSVSDDDAGSGADPTGGAGHNTETKEGPPLVEESDQPRQTDLQPQEPAAIGSGPAACVVTITSPVGDWCIACDRLKASLQRHDDWPFSVDHQRMDGHARYPEIEMTKPDGGSIRWTERNPCTVEEICRLYTLLWDPNYRMPDAPVCPDCGMQHW
jgi:hypothetical protein